MGNGVWLFIEDSLNIVKFIVNKLDRNGLVYGKMLIFNGFNSLYEFDDYEM